MLKIDLLISIVLLSVFVVTIRLASSNRLGGEPRRSIFHRTRPAETTELSGNPFAGDVPMTDMGLSQVASSHTISGMSHHM